MSITAIFANSPFDNEIRIDCNLIKLNSKKNGEICILQNFQKSIFDIENTVIELIQNDKISKIEVIGTGIVKFDNNTFNCFGQFKEIK